MFIMLDVTMTYLQHTKLVHLSTQSKHNQQKNSLVSRLTVAPVKEW